MPGLKKESRDRAHPEPLFNFDTAYFITNLAMSPSGWTLFLVTFGPGVDPRGDSPVPARGQGIQGATGVSSPTQKQHVEAVESQNNCS